jgi:cytoskeletal protein CcmA (bactofilin family)
MRFRESVSIRGFFEGKIEASGYLYIHEEAEVRANIRARDVIVAGTVHGDIEAGEKLEMLSTGKIYGDVRTAKLRIADGVVFEGKCDMIKGADDIDVFGTPVSQLRQTIESDSRG